MTNFLLSKGRTGLDKYFALVFFCALLIRLVFSFLPVEPLSADEVYYESTAYSIYTGKGYSMNGKLTANMCPGYSIFIAGIYTFFGINFLAVRIVQGVVDALMCGVVYLLGSRFINRETGLVAGFLSAAHYFFLKSMQILRPDTLQMFFIVLAAFFWMRWRKTFLKRDVALMALSLSFGIMLKANLVFIPMLFVLIEAVRFLKHKRPSFKVFLKNIIIFILFLSLPIIPWAVRNYKVFHAFVFFTTNYGKALYSSYSLPEGKKIGIVPDDSVMAEAARIESEIEKNAFLIRKAKEYISRHKKEVLYLLPLKALFFWSPFDWETLTKGRGVYNFSTVFILPFFLSGIFLLRKKLLYLTPLVLPIAYLFLLGMFFQGIPRYRMAIEPFLILFAAFCMVYLYEKYSKGKTLSIIAGWFFLNFFMFLHSGYVLSFGKSIAKACGLW